MELGETLADNLVAMGVSASASDGLTTLANKVLDIQTGGSCYHIEFSEDSYTATGGAVTLECTLQQNYSPLVNATVTLSDGGGSVYSSITNQYGVAEFNLTGLTTSATYTCTYQNVSDTCTVNVTTYLFYDGGVTGNYNTDYTKSDSGVTATVSTTGTRISCSTYADCYYRANVVLSGDFEITYNLVSKTNDSGGFALLDTSLNRLGYFEFVNSSKVNLETTTSINGNYSNYTSNSIVKVTRVGNTISAYLDDNFLCSNTISTVDCIFGWKTHSASSRNFTFKELKIF